MIAVRRRSSGLVARSAYGTTGRPSDTFSIFGGLLEQPEWMAGAVCAETDPEMLFPDKGGSTREVKQICAGCDVRAECLRYALDKQERFGVWGELSERERRERSAA